MTLEMATMAVINHAEEELDDDIVSNLSLNLMVSDNEDGGSPNSDRFDKLDSRDASPVDSNNCENTEDDVCNNTEMKDDLQQLRDITGDSSWSTVDDVNTNEFSSDGIKKKIKKTDNKETTSLDTEGTTDEDNTEMTEEENFVSTEEINENKNTERNVDNQKYSIKEKDDEMENEERLLNDVKDSEKDGYDCENLDEDALLSDPRDEDLLQITEEKTTENDTADFLKSCQEDQETSENSCSSGEKAEDNQSESLGDYDESNTGPLEPDGSVTNDDYEPSEVDNETRDTDDLNSIKTSDDHQNLEEDNAEPNNLNGHVEDVHTVYENTSLHSENNINEHELSSNENVSSTTHIVNTEITPDEAKEQESLDGDVTSETPDDIAQSTDEESSRFEQHMESDTETASSAEEEATKINTGSGVLCEVEESAKTQAITNNSSSKSDVNTVSDNITCEDAVNQVDAISEAVNENEDEAEVSRNKATSDNVACVEGAISERDTIVESACESEVLKIDSLSDNVPCDSKVTAENELPEESDLAIDCGKQEAMSMEQQLETQSDSTVNSEKGNAIVNITNDNNELGTNDIADDKKEIVSKNIVSVSAELPANDIINGNNTIAIEEDDNTDLTDIGSAVLVDKQTEMNDEPMDVDDMEFEMVPTHPSIENDGTPSVTKTDVDDPSEQTPESELPNNAQQDVDSKTDANDDSDKDGFRNDGELLLDDNELDLPTSNAVLDEHVINLIDECEPEVVVTTSAQTSISNVQNECDDAANTSTIDMSQSIFINTSNNVISSGIEGDNKECEDMDIEEIVPYKELGPRPNGSVLKQMLCLKNSQNAMPPTLPIVSLPTAADNNIAVVSPQPGEKRLSNDNFQTDSSKRRKLTSLPTKDIRQKYLESFKQAMASANWTKIGRRQLEEFATQKLLEAIHYKTEMGELHKKCMEYKQSLENLRTNSLTLTKQLRDMNSVHLKLEREINLLKTRHRDDDKPLVVVKITRSVGLQALVEDPKVHRRSRTMNTSASTRPATPKQPAQQVAQKPQQLQQQQQQSHPPQLQQKPMIQQQPIQMQTQVPQRMVVSTATGTPALPVPQLQPRPVRSMPTLPPSVVTPTQTRTTSRNKKVPTMVNNTNPPPLRSITQQQTASSPNNLSSGSTIGIPIKHITGPTILNKSIAVSVPSITAPSVTTARTETSKAVIDLTDEDDGAKRTSPIKANQQQQLQQQQRITLMSTVVNGQQVLLRVDGGGPIPSKATTALTNGTPLFVQSPMLQQRTPSNSNAVKMMANAHTRTRTTELTMQPNNIPPAVTQPSPPINRRFRHPAPLPTPPASQALIKGNKPIPPKPTVTVNKSPNGSGIIVKWNMPSMLSLFEKIVRYELFVYQVTKSPPRTDSWGKINDVGALDLPMAVSLTEFAEGNRYYFAVRAVDELGRLGPFSEPQTIVF